MDKNARMYMYGEISITKAVNLQAIKENMYIFSYLKIYVFQMITKINR